MYRKVGRRKSKCLESGGKVSYRDEASARRVLGLIRNTNEEGRRMPERVYECECGSWHLTSLGDIGGLYAEQRLGEKEL